MKLTLFQSIVLLVAVGSYSIVEPASMHQYAGTFEVGESFSAQKLVIRENGTFFYEIFVDVGGASSSEGVWSEVAPGVIITNTYEKEPESEVKVETDYGGQGVTILVLDDFLETTEIPLPEAEVVVWCGEKRFNLVTDDQGRVQMPDCQPTAIFFNHSGYAPALVDLDASTPLNVTAFMSPLTVRAILTDQLWFLFNDKLYRLTYPLERSAEAD